MSTVKLSEMIAESLSEGLLEIPRSTEADPALQIRNRVVADVVMPLAEIRAGPGAAEGTGWRSVRSTRAGRNRLFPVPYGPDDLVVDVLGARPDALHSAHDRPAGTAASPSRTRKCRWARCLSRHPSSRRREARLPRSPWSFVPTALTFGDLPPPYGRRRIHCRGSSNNPPRDIGRARARPI